jgi:putative DNA primase/helicase
VNNETLVLDRLQGVKRSGDGWEARCPVHDDGKASLSISVGQDGRHLLKCHAGCHIEDIVAAIGLTMADLFRPHAGAKVKRRIVATYDYTDETGVLLFQCVRYLPKDFRQRRPDPDKPGKWI